jgi:hypothetical protein
VNIGDRAFVDARNREEHHQPAAERVRQWRSGACTLLSDERVPRSQMDAIRLFAMRCSMLVIATLFTIQNFTT